MRYRPSSFFPSLRLAAGVALMILLMPGLSSAQDAAKGKRVAVVCKACHDLTDARGQKVGPPLWNILNREVGSIEGFEYSEAMLEVGGVWDEERLRAFLSDPRGVVPGNRMVYAGVRRKSQLENLIAYLKTLAD